MDHFAANGGARALIDEALHQTLEALQALRKDGAVLDAIEAAASLLVTTFEVGRRAYACGNGGSMSDAIHFAEQLTGRFRSDRPGLPAQAISDVGHLTCVANDFGYDQVFSRYLLSHGLPGDLLLAISTSGNSANVINAALAAKQRGMVVVALTGPGGGRLGPLAEVCIATPGGKFADRSRELHVKVIHILIELVERHFFPGNYADVSTKRDQG